ncbi:MAG: DUF4876 domain-containing protein [Prevotella sp.]|nr:DUF4876 domain-containing protein [Prevotella sp.]
MKIFTPIRTFALIVGLSLLGADAHAKAEKPSGGSTSGDLVISKVFYNNMVNDAAKSFILANYIELYNNSDKELDITGIYIGLADNTGATSSTTYPNPWTAANMQTAHKDSIALKQIFQIPTDKTYTLEPGKSLVVCNSALNHTTVASKAPDLSEADFEVKSQLSTYKDNHNDAVPELIQVFSYNDNSTYIQWQSPGPFCVVLLAADTNLDKCPTGYSGGRTDGHLFKFVPAFKTIDAVDIVEHSAKTNPDASQKRLPDSYDAGYVATNYAGGNGGEAVVRKTAFVTSNQRIVLWDTNNSSNDFEVTTDLSIRSYSESPVGLTEITITIPESGYLPINPTKPFCGPKGMVFTHVNASNHESTTDLLYGEYPADSILLIKGPWIAIAAPGTYTLKLSDSQGVMKSRSSCTSWCDDNELQLTGSRVNNVIYKFSNVKGNVGFKRVDAVEGKYNKATFSDGDRLYISLSEKNLEKIYASNGAASIGELSFITWHGTTPEKIAAGIDERVVVKKDTPTVFYNLNGQRVEHPTKGIYIQNGKKILVK